MGIIPPGREENNTFKRVGSICLQGKHREMTETSVSRRLRDTNHKRKAERRGENKRREGNEVQVMFLSQVGTCGSSPMVLGGKMDPELRCYILFLKRCPGSRFI